MNCATTPTRRGLSGSLEGRKTQTRRIIKHFDGSTYAKDPDRVRWEFRDQSDIDETTSRWWAYAVGGGSSSLPVYGLRCPYGVPGDRLWVREAFRFSTAMDDHPPRDGCAQTPTWFEADGSKRNAAGDAKAGRYRHARFMPRSVCRLILEVSGVRVDRLQAISEEDAKAEGCAQGDEIRNEMLDPVTGKPTCGWVEKASSARASFCNLWQWIHRRPHDELTAWEENPFVWAITFKVITPAPGGAG